MSAIISLDAFRLKRGKPSLRDQLEDAIATHLRQTYPQYPWMAHWDAIDVARTLLDRGGSVLDAREAAEQALLLRYRPSSETDWQTEQDIANEWRLINYKLRCSIVEAQLTKAMREIRTNLKDRPMAEIFDAMQRARRVLDGGGTVDAAVYQALKNQ